MEKKVLAIIIGLIIITSTIVSFSFLMLSANGREISFFVLGDSQGYEGSLSVIVDDANQQCPDFVFHCGDLTPFSQENQYASVQDTISTLLVPFHTTPGNHDVRLEGRSLYNEYFGSENYSFDVGIAHFISLDTSTGDVDEGQFHWLENELTDSDANWKIVFTHMPMFDPRPGEDHSLLNLTTASRLMDLFESTNVDAVFTGHIHMSNITTVNGVKYIITGGAGASLAANPDEGGVYHYVKVSLDASEMILNIVPLPEPDLDTSNFLLSGNEEDITLSVSDLQDLELCSGLSSFQNQFENWRSFGNYTGVRLSTLIELVGGITPNQTLRVVASDGFEQQYCYSNIYPNASWYGYQGDMILAFALNGTYVPNWEDGLRIVFLPDDHGYSNSDCLATSAEGQGCNVYVSAGARWIRYVSLIEVIG